MNVDLFDWMMSGMLDMVFVCNELVWWLCDSGGDLWVEVVLEWFLLMVVDMCDMVMWMWM